MDNLMQMVLQPFTELGPDVSVSIYQVPESFNNEQARALLPLLPGGAKMNHIAVPGGQGLLAVGGLLDPQVLLTVHGALMSIMGVDFVLGCGPGSALLPRTAAGQAAVGASARAAAASKPKWKFWK
jgi:hypothetical protein